MRLMSLQKWVLAIISMVMVTGVLPAYSDEGDPGNGETIYLKRCVGCHGVDGDGLGPGADRLVPPPRDFTSGMFKIMSTAFEGYIPQDQDIYEMIRIGMPGTAMPGWEDMLNSQEMWDLVAYIKTFSGYDEEEAEPALEYGTQIPSSQESIDRGSELFHEEDRCSECHGLEGKGDAIKRLLGDIGERTWPRNLTKPWTYRHDNDPKSIFARVSIGIPGTQMPSFADPASSKVLSEEDRWHVANYVNSLAKVDEVVFAENTVVKSRLVDSSIPDDPYDVIWDETIPSTFMLVPQIIAEDRLFTPSNDTITVRSLYTSDEIAVLLEWDDRTKSLPGDEDAEKIAEPGLSEDRVAVQLPINLPEGMEKPYFGLGDTKNPVNLWQWNSGTTTESESVSVSTATGFGTDQVLDTNSLKGNGVYKSGTWRVLLRRNLAVDSEQELTIEPGVFIPVGFLAWDGSNGESGTKHTLTTWYWLLLEPEASTLPVFGGLLAFLLIGSLEFLWLRSASGGTPAGNRGSQDES